MSVMSAGQAVQAGFKNVRVYLDGKPAWEKAGNATYASYDFIYQGNNVVVDLRSADKATKSRIPRSVSMPFASFNDSVAGIPAKAAVVIYSDNDEESLAALKILNKAGTKNVSLVEGGYQGWKRLGGELIKGPVVTDVEWERSAAPGEVTVADFNTAIKDPSKAVIIDVRTDEEVNIGKIEVAQHIPLDQLSRKTDAFFATINGMSKEQNIYIYCKSGSRAEMAYKELQKNGYKKAKFLMADVSCEKNDCKIEG